MKNTYTIIISLLIVLGRFSCKNKDNEGATDDQTNITNCTNGIAGSQILLIKI